MEFFVLGVGQVTTLVSHVEPQAEPGTGRLGSTWVHETDKLHKHADPYTAIHPKSWQRCAEAEGAGTSSVVRKRACPYALRKKIDRR